MPWRVGVWPRSPVRATSAVVAPVGRRAIRGTPARRSAIAVSSDGGETWTEPIDVMDTFAEDEVEGSDVGTGPQVVDRDQAPDGSAICSSVGG